MVVRYKRLTKAHAQVGKLIIVDRRFSAATQNLFEEKSKCALERAFQMELSKQKNRTAEFIPECEIDGSYSTVQVCTRFYTYSIVAFFINAVFVVSQYFWVLLVREQ